MSVRPSKSSLARVTSKATAGSSYKKPQFFHSRSTEKDQQGIVPSTVASPVVLSTFFIDLEVALDTAPTFDECIDDLPLHTLMRVSSKGKEKVPSSLLDDEDRVITHFHSVLSNSDTESFRYNSTSDLAKSTFFDLGKVNVAY